MNENPDTSKNTAKMRKIYGTPCTVNRNYNFSFNTGELLEALQRPLRRKTKLMMYQKIPATT